MIDLALYRLRIGNIYCKCRKIKLLNKKQTCKKVHGVGKKTLEAAIFFILVSLIVATLPTPSSTEHIPLGSSYQTGPLRKNSSTFNPPNLLASPPLFLKSRRQSVNFKARYIHGNPATKRGIKNMHLNIRSLGNKMFEIKNVIKENKPHILGLSECELRKVQGYFDENRLKVPGYSILFPKSWRIHGFARVLVYVKDSLDYEQVTELQDDLAQSVWLRGSFRGSKRILFCHLYREHTSTLGSSLRVQRSSLETLLGQWEAATLLGNPDGVNETHVCGDMNLDSLDGRWLRPDYHLISLSRMVQAACTTSNFSQLVTCPTRAQFNSVRGTTDISSIDHVYCNTKFRCSEVSVITFGNSDHDLICYTRFSKEPAPPASTIRKRSYKEFDKDKFLADLSKVDWGLVYHCQEVDEAECTFTRIFQSILNIHAPWIVFQQRKRFVPWLTQETKELIRQRDQWKSTARTIALENPDRPASREQIEAWNNYKKLRNTINNKKKNEEKEYKKKRVIENIDSPEKTWKIAKQIMEWKQKGPPKQLQVGHRLVTNSRAIAEHLNTFFTDKILKIRKGLGELAPDLTACYNIMRGKNCHLSLKHVSVSQIKKLLKNLKNTKSTAVDGLDNFCIKVSSDIIAQPLHHIISLSIMQCKFPTSWKYSKIVPIHKKDSLLESSNYRPVAILSPLGKILEKVIFEQLYNHFSNNKIFHSSLHGYRHHRSTQTALLQLYDRWIRAAHMGQVSGVVLLDLSAAFDLVDHQLLVRKLRIYGVDSGFCDWVSSYLTDRYQAVWLSHCFSSFLPCNVGVPQGSNLGPLFFLIFFNDLPFHLDCNIEAYADDSTVSSSGNNPDRISETLTSNCTTVSNWMKQNKFKLNAGKTHILTVGTSIRVDNLETEVKVEMDDTTLMEDVERSEKLLGVHIEYNLKWHKTLAELRSRLKSRLAGLMRLRYVVPYNYLKIVTQGIFNSIMVYCLPLFGGCDRVDLDSLQVIQNKAAQIVTRSPPRSPRKPMYDQLDWLTVNQLVAYHTLLQIFKIRKSQEPEYLFAILGRDNRNGHIVVTNTHLSLAKKSFTFRGSELWNQLPADIRTNHKLGNFKKACRNWIKAEIPRFPND